MTKENIDLREKIRAIESLAASCLRNQPDDDAECEAHLSVSLAKIADACAEFFGKYCVEAYDIVWDTDGRDPDELGLPSSMKLVVGQSDAVDIGEEIADMLSDRSGWCVESLKYRRI